jgi:O-antigen/teichoic acid export membrane protein
LKSYIQKFLFLSERRIVLIKNFSYLTFLQVFNLILPLLTYPYLIRVLGKETFGLLIFAQVVIGYLVILVNFGFNLSATKEVSIHRNNRVKLNEIISSVYLIKLVLFILSFFILFILYFLFDEIRQNILLFCLTMWMCFYDFIFPIWYFQGVERMKYITIITIISRILFLTLIFVFIKKQSDFLMVPVFYGLGSVLSGVLSVFILKRQKIKLSWQPFKVIKIYFLDSLPIFISYLSTTFYLSTNKVILGVFIGMQEVAFYEVAEKLSLILKTPIQLIGQVVYPQASNYSKKAFLKNIFIFTLIIAFLILILSVLLGDVFIRLMGGMDMQNTNLIFRILILSIIPVTFSLFFGNIILTSRGYNRYFLRLRIYASVFYLLLMGFLFITNSINLVNLAVVTVIVEVFSALYSYFLTGKFKINFLKSNFLESYK